MIKMVVFDMAGTTVNEHNVVYKTLHRAINEAGFSVTLEQVLAEGAGNEKLQAIKSILRVYAHNDNNLLSSKIYKNFITLLEIAYQELDILPHPNAVELFKALKEKDIKIVLNTGYNKETARFILTKLGWERGVEFDGLVTASDVQQNRPEPDMILMAMGQFNIDDPSEVVKVGDSIIDIQEGRNAGCAINIGITTGAHTLAQLQSAKPEFTVDDLMELLPIVLNHS